MNSEREPLDVLDAIATTRAMRRLKPDPIPDDVIRAILEAAVCAPSGGNQQTWSFIVIRDSEIKKRIQELYYQAAQEYFAMRDASANPTSEEDQQQANRVRRSAAHLAEHIHEAPVLIMCCIRGRESFSLGSSTYPAVQNLMLAARAFGIGSTLTTFHRAYDEDIHELLNIPEKVQTAALIPLGYPQGRWAEGKRKPLEGIVFADRFGEKLYN